MYKKNVERIRENRRKLLIYLQSVLMVAQRSSQRTKLGVVLLHPHTMDKTQHLVRWGLSAWKKSGNKEVALI